MASTIQTIQANLQAMGFDNTSNTALYNMIAVSVGEVVDNTITEMSNSENNILSIINLQRYGKTGYYTSTALAFQYGDDLIIDPDTGNFIYAVIDPTKQIVVQAAFEEITTGSNSELFLKIAALDALSGLLVQLTGPQLAAFTTYFLNFEIPGLPVSIINNPANILSFNAVATFYATYDLTNLQTNLANALNNFRDTFEFNGEFFAGDLQDYIKQNVPGMRDFFISATTIDGTAFQGSVTLDSGYFNYIATILANITYNGI